MELRAELTGRDGVKRPLRVSYEPSGELQGLLGGLAQLQERVGALLGPLVEQESGGGGGDRSGLEGNEEEDIEDEEENHVNAKSWTGKPPLKRKKRHP